MEATFVNNARRVAGRTRPGTESSRESGTEGPALARQIRADVETRSLSFIVPLKDEEATLGILYQRIADECEGWATFEVIFVDDGSRDNSWQVIQELARRHPECVRGIRFRGNRGKAAAWTAGFRAARGAVVFTMDADLQDDPGEIRSFLAKLDEGYDLVSGYKKVRHDPWHKVLPSRIFNAMISRASGVRLHDHNCGFKCLRSEVAASLTLHGEMHRMVPSLAAMRGFKSAEVVVRHHPRTHGVSKYGVERFLRGFMDMATVGFLRRYRERPSHFFGGVAASCAAMAACGMSAGVVGFVLAGWRLGAAIAALFGTVMFGTAILAFLGGILAELVTRGGLNQNWSLPITEDTRFDRKDASRLTDIPTSYGIPS